MRRYGKRMILVAALLLAFVACSMLEKGSNAAKAGNRCVIDTAMMKTAFNNVSGTITKLYVAASAPVGYTASAPINSDGSAMLYVVGDTVYLAPATAGDVLAITGNCALLFSGGTKFPNLQEVSLVGLDTSGVTAMNGMFYQDSKLKKVNLTGLNMSLVEDFESMFFGCSSLTEIQFDWETANTVKLTSVFGMFYQCSSLEELDLSGIHTDSVTTMENMFFGCEKLVSLNLTGMKTDNVTSMANMFHGCEKLASLNLSEFVTTNVQYMQGMFSQCRHLTELNLGNFDTKNVLRMSYMFSECGILKSINLSSFVTSKVTNMSYMFYECPQLLTLDVSRFDTSEVTNMSFMFCNCRALTKLNLSRFNTDKVTTMESMFEYCMGLTEMNLPNFTCFALTNVNRMFADCTSLKTADLSGFSTKANGSDAYFTAISMFESCSSLESVNLINLSFQMGGNDPNLAHMFGGLAQTVNNQNINTLQCVCVDPKNAMVLFSRAYNNSMGVYGIKRHDCGEANDQYCKYCGACMQVAMSGRHNFTNTGDSENPVYDGPCSFCGACYELITNGQHKYVNGICTCCGDDINDYVPYTCEGFSVSLKGNIELLAYFTFADDLMKSSQSYVEFEVADGSKNKAYVIESGQANVGDKKYRVFSCEVSAKEMADTILLSVYSEEGVCISQKPISVSVQQYANVILQSADYDTTAKNLVQAMLTYGAYAQKYFGYNTNQLADAGNELTLPSAGAVRDAVAGKAPYIKANSGRGIRYIGNALVLNETVDVRFYFRFTDYFSNLEKTKCIGEMSLIKFGGDDTYYYAIENCQVSQWDEKYTNSGIQYVVVEYSVLSYIHDVLDIYDSGALVNLVKAMYLYWDAAEDYMAAHP